MSLACDAIALGSNQVEVEVEVLNANLFRHTLQDLPDIVICRGYVYGIE